MVQSLIFALKQKMATDPIDFPDLPAGSRGLPRLTQQLCQGLACGDCQAACPTSAIQLDESDGRCGVSIDLGKCIGCGACIAVCPSGTIESNPSTKTATLTREALVIRQGESPSDSRQVVGGSLARSIDIREISTGCNATDQEVAAITNPVFDCSRFGIHFVASPRFADALVVTGPVGRAMQDPLIRTYKSMPEPRIVIAAGTCAISGGLHAGGYAEANGVLPHVPVNVFVPGCPPHPWSILHGILLAMGSTRAHP
ncbi:MAG: 4Fe-4S binding protein [Fimbriimonas sp.]|nr:4Fe-4S binding protein [Fimbriimonas sp.]